jgi:membrane protein YdbS with pleckstrin-like domain
MPDIFIKPENTKKELLTAADSVPSDHVRMFSSFCVNPLGVSFIDQEPDEKILLFLRPHFITNALWIFIAFILALIPIFFLIFRINFVFLEVPSLPFGFVAIFAIFYYLLIFSYTFVNFINWFYNVLLVTQKRVVDVDYSDIVVHNIAFTKLTHVQEVNYTQAGFIRSFFNFGDIFIQTAGPEINLEGLSVPQPRRAAQIMANLIGRRSRV